MLNNPVTVIDDHPGYISGYYYTPSIGGATLGSGNSLVTTSLYFEPFYVAKAITINRIGISVQAGTGVAGNNIRLGIYNNGANGLPSTLIVDAGNVDCSTAGNKEAIINVILQPGWYWFAIGVNSNPTVATFSSLACQTTLGKPTFDITNVGSFRYTTFSYGALPANAPASFSTSTLFILIWLKIV